MKTILLIEDNKDVRENTAEILGLSNYRVLTAENGKAGAELAIREIPDLIICDIMMPVLDGYGVLHLLGRNKETANIPFIFLTAKTDRADVRKGMEMGADDYITKPFEESELLNAIETRLRKTELLQKDFAPGAEGFNQFILEVKKIEQLKNLAANHEEHFYRKRQLIYEAERHPKNLFFLAKGKIKIFKTNEDGKDLIISILKDGDYFGYISLLEEKLYTDSAEAMEDSQVIIIPGNEFLQLLNSDIIVAGAFIRMMANNISDKEDQLIQLAYNSVRKRVADALLSVFNRYKKTEQDQPALRVTREDLAKVVGTATESLIRTLSDFKSEKLIDIRNGTISILNEAKLKAMLN